MENLITTRTTTTFVASGDSFPGQKTVHSCMLLSARGNRISVAQVNQVND